eukprot:366064-Chlamydomonas_euryale.AAC.2
MPGEVVQSPRPRQPCTRMAGSPHGPAGLNLNGWLFPQPSQRSGGSWPEVVAVALVSGDGRAQRAGAEEHAASPLHGSSTLQRVRPCSKDVPRSKEWNPVPRIVHAPTRLEPTPQAACRPKNASAGTGQAPMLPFAHASACVGLVHTHLYQCRGLSRRARCATRQSGRRTPPPQFVPSRKATCVGRVVHVEGHAAEARNAGAPGKARPSPVLSDECMHAAESNAHVHACVPTYAMPPATRCAASACAHSHMCTNRSGHEHVGT